MEELVFMDTTEGNIGSGTELFTFEGSLFFFLSFFCSACFR